MFIFSWTNFGDVGALLFGLLMMLATASLVFAVLVRDLPKLHRPILILHVLTLLIMAGILLFDFSGSTTHLFAGSGLSDAVLSHRWMLFPAAILLTISNAVVVLVFGEKIASGFAQDYRRFGIISAALVLCLFAVIAFETTL